MAKNYFQIRAFDACLYVIKTQYMSYLRGFKVIPQYCIEYPYCE